MTKSIDAERLKESAEQLEQVLRQYPESEDIMALLEALRPMIEGAKTRTFGQPIDSTHIPGAYNFSDGMYSMYRNPDVGGAYADFIRQASGGLDDIGREITEYIDLFKASLGGRIKGE